MLGRTIAMCCRCLAFSPCFFQLLTFFKVCGCKQLRPREQFEEYEARDGLTSMLYFTSRRRWGFKHHHEAQILFELPSLCKKVILSLAYRFAS